MQSIQSILVPIDFSDISLNAFKYALRLADQVSANIDLLNVVPLDDGTLMGISLTAQQISLGKTKLKDFFEQGIDAVTGKVNSVPPVRSFVKNGALRSIIRNHVEAAGNNLIIMGTAGEEDENGGNLFGSNTSHLVTKSPCPVLVIPKDLVFKPFKSICYATDLEHIDAFHAGLILKAFRVFQPRLDFVHVKTGKDQKTNFDMDLLREMFDRPETGLEARFHILEDGEVVDEIFNYAETVEADLVVMYRPHRGWLSQLFSKSNTYQAALETKAPLLVIPHDTLGQENTEQQASKEIA